ncbi:conserved hypothetical protein [Tenacibaculum sp. 190524A05c]|uniref:hypothetical protein n=1 Tax=Tenacibaculum platacis TaxID=3137852 RepID=UPI0031FB5F31
MRKVSIFIFIIALFNCCEVKKEVDIKGNWSFLKRNKEVGEGAEWDYEEWFVTKNRIYRFSYYLGERIPVYYKIEDGNLYVNVSTNKEYSIKDLQGQINQTEKGKFILMNPYSIEFNRIENSEYKLSDFLHNEGNSNERLKIDSIYTQHFFNRFNSITKRNK